MSKKFCVTLILAAWFNFWASSAAQESTRPQKPLGPTDPRSASSPENDGADQRLAAEKQKVEPDSRPLAGAQSLTLGSISPSRNFLLPSFSVATQVGTNQYNTNQAGNRLESLTYLTGRLLLNRTSGATELALNYLAGGNLSKNGSQGNSLIQGLNVSDMIRKGRWSFMLGDDFSYLSESSFGFGGLGGLDFLGIGNGLGSSGSNPSFRPDLVPTQSILTSRAPRLSNTAIFQTNYMLNRRSSLTFVGSYGVLRFVDAGFFNSRSPILQAGYNRALGRRDSISIFYRFSSFKFSRIAQSFEDQSIQLTYARRIAGRISFQVGGGPEISTFRTPLTSSGTRINSTVASSLSYQYQRNTIGFNFNRGLTGGSGVLPGAETDVFQGFWNRRLNQDWDTALVSGFSRNRSLPQTLLAAYVAPNTWFITSNVNRTFGRSGDLFFLYTARRQSSLPSSFTNVVSGFGSLIHTFSVGYTWGLRPIHLE